MLNEEKVILMTRLAMYEQDEGKKEIPMSKYYQNDYVGIHMLGTFITTTLAFILIVALYVLSDLEGFLSNLTNLNVREVIFRVAVGYGGLVAFYLIVARIVYTRRFKLNRLHLNEYHGNLKKLLKLHEIDREEMKKKVEGTEEDWGEPNYTKTFRMSREEELPEPEETSETAAESKRSTSESETLDEVFDEDEEYMELEEDSDDDFTFSL